MTTRNEAHGAEEEGARDSGSLAVLCIHGVETRKVRMPQEIRLEERFEVGKSVARDEVENVEIFELRIDAREQVGGEAGLLSSIVDEN